MIYGPQSHWGTKTKAAHSLGSCSRQPRIGPILSYTSTCSLSLFAPILMFISFQFIYTHAHFSHWHAVLYVIGICLKKSGCKGSLVSRCGAISCSPITKWRQTGTLLNERRLKAVWWFVNEEKRAKMAVELSCCGDRMTEKLSICFFFSI